MKPLHIVKAVPGNLNFGDLHVRIAWCGAQARQGAKFVTAGRATCPGCLAERARIRREAKERFAAVERGSA